MEIIHAALLTLLLTFQRFHFFLSLDSNAAKQGNDLALDPVQHIRNQFKGLSLIFLFWIFLSETA